jgi:hypothetical protein
MSRMTFSRLATRPIAAPSGNSYIAAIVGMLTAQMRRSIVFMHQNITHPVKHLTAVDIAEHAAIHDVIMRRSARAAREAMRAHITAAAGHLSRVRTRWKRRGKGPRRALSSALIFKRLSSLCYKEWPFPTPRFPTIIH